MKIGYGFLIIGFFCLPTCMANIPLGWGKPFPDQNQNEHALVFDQMDPYGCNENINMDYSKSIRVVDRGNCTFLKKATVAKKKKAMGLLIRNTLQAVYEQDIVKKNTSNGHSPYAYDCENGQAYVSTLEEQPWKTTAVECTSNTSCASSQCLPTGIFDMEKGGHQLCCIWDTFTILGANKTQAKALGVNAIYVGMVTIKIGNDLEMKLASQDAVSLSLRYRPTVDPSSFFLWLLAVCTVMLGSMMNVRKPSNGAPSGSNQDGFDPSTETIPELTASHALGFLLSACTTLLILYFFQPHILLALIFAFLSTIATSSVLFTPLFERMSSFQVHVSFFGMSRGELCGTLCGGFIAVFWFIFRKEIQLTWLLQDGFGVCVCVFFLSTIRIPTLRIGAILLSLAFAYDVFFVFLTPLLFGSSVMEDVATGGKGPASKADFPGSDYCERYPQDSRCEWPEMVPMVMVMPILMDFVGGFTMLGYGDIVLPGLLVALSFRSDVAYKHTATQRVSYFPWMCTAYGIGLATAMVVATVFESGQPALFYLTPCTVGMFIALSKYNGEFQQIWTENGERSHEYVQQVSPGVETTVFSEGCDMEEDGGCDTTALL